METYGSEKRKEKMKHRMKQMGLYLLAGCVFLIGFLVLSYPSIQRNSVVRENKKEIGEFKEGQKQREQSEKSQQRPTENRDGEELYEKMEAYNRQIFEEHQKYLCDVWSQEQMDLDFSMESSGDGMIGYVTVEAMDEEFPLYMNDTQENLNRGGVVVSQTSMPIGGKNTNCVIAAHRTMYMKGIEQLKPKDRVTVTNLWGTLEYEVVKSIVVSPNEVDAIKIMEGEDMLTLLTCHPYGVNTDRFVVYCKRVEDGGEDWDTGWKGEEMDGGIPFDGKEYESSEKEIAMEEWVSRVGKSVCIVLFLWAVIRAISNGRKVKENELKKK